MSEVVKAFIGARIYDGQELRDDQVLFAYSNGHVEFKPLPALPASCPTERLMGGVISPGFVDLQVNGGGGVMFNDDQSVETLRTIALAHGTIGTTALLPTLITDTPQKTKAAIVAVEKAMEQRITGIAGIHLEGPHLSVARKGAHDPQLIRQMTDEDMNVILRAAEQLPNVMVTVAPENTSNAQIRKMADAGIVVSLGHTDADLETCLAAFDAGASCATHLFNAMSQLGNREPGLVGAALTRDDVYAGLIADGIHVHPTTIRVALSAKAGSDRVFLVTDAMATAGSQIDGFQLNGRKVLRQAQRLTLQDGTLAGADLEMAQAVSVITSDVGKDPACALSMATTVPASLLREKNVSDWSQQTLNSLVYLKEGTVTAQRLSMDTLLDPEMAQSLQ